MKNFKKIQGNNSGIIIVQTLIFSSISILIIGALSGWTATAIKAGRIAFNREQAFQAAEAGIDYYRWHLAHAPTDYQDGTGMPGPHVRDLKDRSGNTVARFSLNITAPQLGSTIVVIESTGSSIKDPSYTRKIESRLAKPSIAKYAFAGHSNMRFGPGTEIFGTVHSNGGIRFDGLAHNIVTSATTSYTANDSDACTTINSYGVHTCLPPQDPTFPTPLPSRPTVFEAGRLISQPAINFSGFTADLAILKANAQANGFYRDAAGGSFRGYRILLRTNDTFDLFRVNTWAGLGSCTTQTPNTLSWSIGTQTLLGNYAFPANGIIFIEDHVVVEGTIDGARLTIAAADLPVPAPTGFKNIIINNDINYTYFDGRDSIGLIGQGAVLVGMISDTNLRIDAALIAQNDRVGRFYFSGSSCAFRNRASLTLYGMIASYLRYGFSYTDGTGYAIRNLTYDANLLYAPPPDFPLTSSQYQILSWQEKN